MNSLPSPSSLSSTSSSTGTTKKRTSKSHVPTACVNCKKAHLACDLSRPCKRCVSVGRADTCYDIQHKKRGRPKLRDKRITAPWKTMPALAPGFAHSRFIMTQPPSYTEAKAGNTATTQRPQILTMFLSIDLRCARVSDESLELIGLYPQELAHRSLYEFIVPEDTEALARVHRCLLSARLPNTQTMVHSTSSIFTSFPPSNLLSIANGSQTFKEKLSIQRSEGTTELFDARFYLGGGLGADLFVSSSLSQLYIVCLLTPADRSSSPRSISPKQQSQPQQQPLSSISTHSPPPPPPPPIPPPALDHHQPPPPPPTPTLNDPTAGWPSAPTTGSASQDDDSSPIDHQPVWMHPHDYVYPLPNTTKSIVNAPSSMSINASNSACAFTPTTSTTSISSQ
ncbi:hypothetical protein RO3G_11678 [Lichtheimia corymbifera JMRC:FSU:9682]|uniref:Zn(2)-C6 fungal-type domain-containing protein n=1 Tax=Lichtheimia corymbifera JMRC:FSU:9682 TaxID=1263082 RepID=A0A068SFD9_9FUNG|nr:hypothetical protein RO3G_11678 [Lichtheimia corymbifera JMRC:FSU:9682]